MAHSEEVKGFNPCRGIFSAEGRHREGFLWAKLVPDVLCWEGTLKTLPWLMQRCSHNSTGSTPTSTFPPGFNFLLSRVQALGIKVKILKSSSRGSSWA